MITDNRYPGFSQIAQLAGGQFRNLANRKKPDRGFLPMILAMTIDQAEFRAAMRNRASGVALVTASEGGNRAGLTVSAFSSLSLEPPLVLACIDRRSGSLPVVERAGAFALNMLAEDQAELARRFATRGGVDKFAGGAWRAACTGAPVLDSALAWLDCKLVACYPGGDHTILIGRAVASFVNTLSLAPLMYFGGCYHQLGALAGTLVPA